MTHTRASQFITQK